MLIRSVVSVVHVCATQSVTTLGHGDKRQLRPIPLKVQGCIRNTSRALILLDVDQVVMCRSMKLVNWLRN